MINSNWKEENYSSHRVRLIYSSQTGNGCVLELLKLTELEAKLNANSAFRIVLCTSMCRFNVMAATVDKIAIVAAVQSLLDSDDSEEEVFKEKRRLDEEIEVGAVLRARRRVERHDQVCVKRYIEDVVNR